MLVKCSVAIDKPAPRLRRESCTARDGSAGNFPTLPRSGSRRTVWNVAALPPRVSQSSPATNPLFEALETAPLDDEPCTDEDRAADEAARVDVKRGNVVTTAELRRRLGL
jgi:hypothetical protein